VFDEILGNMHETKSSASSSRFTWRLVMPTSETQIARSPAFSKPANSTQENLPASRLIPDSIRSVPTRALAIFCAASVWGD
jgi:hypothetical protein